MKMLFKFSSLLLLISSSLYFWSCSKEEALQIITAADLNTTITENPTFGQILGVIITSESSDVSFEVVTSEPVGAVDVNPLTGEVFVADPALFDFEQYTNVVATIRVSKEDALTFANISINIEDADDLLTILSASRAAYEAETVGWVQITKEEYDALAERVSGVQKVGVPDFHYDAPGDVFQTSTDLTVTNTLNIPIPPGSYFFAFKYHSIAEESSGVRPKVSENSITSGYSGRGPLPAHGPGDQYFVRKGASVVTNNNAFLGLYSPYSMGWKENFANEMYYRFGNGSSLSNGQNNVLVLFQGLTTSVKQWN